MHYLASYIRQQKISVLIRSLWLPVLVLLLVGCGTRRMGGFEVHGIDVSRYQEDIYWNTVALQPIDFVFIKATEGMAIKDPAFDRNWLGAAEAGLIRGAYHFFIPTVDPKLQAEKFTATVKLEKGDLPPVIDLEIRGPQAVAKYQADIRAFSDALEAHYGIRPILYSSQRYYQDFLQSAFPDHTVWLAFYRRHRPAESLGIPWLFWQYTDKGSLRGIDGPVDLNVFRGTKAGLRALTLGYMPDA